jgi:hypothetical protein
VYAAGGSLFLLRWNPGTESFPLWASDGTAAGTRPVAAAPPLPNLTTESFRNMPVLSGADGRFYFGVRNPTGDNFHRGALWATDGTDIGTFKVAEFANLPRPLAYQDGNVYGVEGFSPFVADPAARTGAGLGQEGYDPDNLDFAVLNGRYFYASTQNDDVRPAFTSAVDPTWPSVYVRSFGLNDGEAAPLHADVRVRNHDTFSHPFTITWDLDGDGAFDDATGADVALSGADLAARLTGDHFRYRARADDGNGQVAESRTGEVLVFQAPPTPAIQGPHTYAQGAEVEFAVTYTDASGLDPASLVGNDSALQVATRGSSGVPEWVVPARYVSIDATTPGTSRTVVYRATLPEAIAQGTQQTLAILLTTTGARDVKGNGYSVAGEFGGLAVYALPADLNSPPPGIPKNVSGKLLNVFTSDGQEATAGLALRRVYADANANGAFDAGEMSALTDFDGAFAFFAPPGAVLRAEMADGWAGAGGGDGSVPVNLRLNTPQVRLAPAAPVVVDVLVAYGTVEGGPAFDMSATRQTLRDTFALANRPFGNSDTMVVINLVGVLPVWYSSAGLARQDLAKLMKDGDGPLDEVHRERDRVGADVVLLIPSQADTPRRDRVAGIARQLARPAGEPQAAFAFVTSAHDPNVLSHEIGHVLGAGHERAIMKRGITPYAHGFVAPNNEFWDVMSYGTSGTPGLPFFSDPRRTYNGMPTGDAATADNARTIREFAPVVAAYRQRPANGPAGEPTAVDLTVTVDAKPPKRARPGAPLSAGAVVTNAGGATALGTVGVTFFLSSDPVLDGTDTNLGGAFGKTMLKAGQAKRFRGRFKLPPGLAPGTYYVLAQTSAGPTRPEPNTANNVAAGPQVTVSA